jgi:hypothetical protein
MRHGLSELDFGIAGARIEFLLGGPDEGSGHCGRESRGKRGGAEFAPGLFVLHCCFLPDGSFDQPFRCHWQ